MRALRLPKDEPLARSLGQGDPCRSDRDRERVGAGASRSKAQEQCGFELRSRATVAPGRRLAPFGQAGARPNQLHSGFDGFERFSCLTGSTSGCRQRG
jgi:hypothetical protein